MLAIEELEKAFSTNYSSKIASKSRLNHKHQK